MNRFLQAIVVLALAASLAPGQVPPPPSGKTMDRGPTAQLFVPERIKDLGTILDGDKINISWTIENHGDAPLIIDRTVSTCGCTIVRLTDVEKTIAPRGALELKATFDSTGRRETQNKTITVYSNDPVEPELKLQFKAEVESLVEMQPDGLVNLRQVRRGDHIAKGVDFVPGGSHKSLTVSRVEPPDDFPIRYELEPLPTKQGTGQRMHFIIPDTVALGPVNTAMKVFLSIDGIERERLVPLRGEVVGELIWTPKLIDATRQPSLPGKKLVPVMLSSTRTAPFKIENTEAGPMLEPIVESVKKGAGTEYSITVAIRPDAPPGPFAAMLRVFTDVPDQPLVEIPVFGMISAPIEVDPAVVLLREDGTPAGGRRHVKIQTHPTMELNLKSITCDDPSIKFGVDESSLTLYRHLRFMDVGLVEGSHGPPRKTKLVVITNVPGAERLEIPVSIEAGKAGQ